MLSQFTRVSLDIFPFILVIHFYTQESYPYAVHISSSKHKLVLAMFGNEQFTIKDLTFPILLPSIMMLHFVSSF